MHGSYRQLRREEARQRRESSANQQPADEFYVPEPTEPDAADDPFGVLPGDAPTTTVPDESDNPFGLD